MPANKNNIIYLNIKATIVEAKKRKKLQEKQKARSERNNKTKYTITIPCDFPTYASFCMC